MPTVPETFAAINARAIELMTSKLFDSAEELLDQGIQYLEGQGNDDDSEAGDGAAESSQSRNSTVRLETVITSPVISTPVVGSKQDTSFAMFDKAFGMVPASLSSIGTLSDFDMSILLCVLHYNLGLCYRLSGVASTQRTEEHEDHIEKSLFAYEMAYNYLIEVTQECEKMDQSVRLLELALLNNLGHMYCLLSDTTEAGFRLGQMKTILDEWVFSTEQTSLCIKDDEIAIFSCNVNYHESLLAGMPPPAA